MSTGRKTLKIVKRIVKNPWLLGAVLGTGVFAADQLFKSSIELQPEEIFPHDLAGTGGRAELEKLHNTGLAMGRLSGDPEKAEALASAGTVSVVLSLFSRGRKDRAGIISDLIVAGGAASNLYDRKKRGYVVDYIHLKKGPLSKIVFNLGDAAVAAGALTGGISRFLCSGEERKGKR